MFCWFSYHLNKLVLLNGMRAGFDIANGITTGLLTIVIIGQIQQRGSSWFSMEVFHVLLYLNTGTFLMKILMGLYYERCCLRDRVRVLGDQYVGQGHLLHQVRILQSKAELELAKLQDAKCTCGVVDGGSEALVRGRPRVVSLDG